MFLGEKINRIAEQDGYFEEKDLAEAIDSIKTYGVEKFTRASMYYYKALFNTIYYPNTKNLHGSENFVRALIETFALGKVAICRMQAEKYNASSFEEELKNGMAAAISSVKPNTNKLKSIAI